MSLKKQFVKKMADLAQSRFGQSAWIGGIEYKVTFNDEEFQGEAGFGNELTIGVTPEQSIFFKEGHLVLIDFNEYRIIRVPRENTNSPLIYVEIKRA